MVCNTGGSPEQELKYLTLLQRQRAAAVVLTGGAVVDAPHAAAVAAKLRKLGEGGTRVVLCGRPRCRTRGRSRSPSTTSAGRGR